MITLLTCITTTMQAEHTVNLDLSQAPSTYANSGGTKPTYNTSTKQVSFSSGTTSAWIYWELALDTKFTSLTMTVNNPTIDLTVTIRYYVGSTLKNASQTISSGAGEKAVTVDVPAEATGIYNFRLENNNNAEGTVTLVSATLSDMPDNLPLSLIYLGSGSSNTVTYDSSTKTITYNNSSGESEATMYKGWVFKHNLVNDYKTVVVELTPVEFDVTLQITYTNTSGTVNQTKATTIKAGNKKASVRMPDDVQTVTRVILKISCPAHTSRTLTLTNAYMTVAEEQHFDMTAATSTWNGEKSSYNAETFTITWTAQTRHGWSFYNTNYNDYKTIIVKFNASPVALTGYLGYMATSDAGVSYVVSSVAAGATMIAWTIPSSLYNIAVVHLYPASACSLTLTDAYATNSELVFDMSSAGYATYYHSTAVQLPAGMKAATVDGIGSNTLTLNWRYDGDNSDVIPGGTAVLLKGNANRYMLTLKPSDTTDAPAGNLLDGSDRATTTSTAGADKYYKLSYGHSDSEYKDILGWYYGAEEGGAFTIGAHKAWLALTNEQAGLARYFSLEDEQPTGMNEVRSKMSEVRGGYFNLNGQRVAQPVKGLYIVNGKKVVIK